MTKHTMTLFLTTIIAIALLPSLASAQDTPDKSKTPHKTFGVGVVSSLDGPFGNDESPSPRLLLLVPLQLSESFRIEPEIGFDSVSTEQEDSERDETRKIASSSFRAGVGLLYTQRVSKKTVLMGGVRLGGIQLNRKTTLPDFGGDLTTRESTQNAFYGGLVTGAEYFLSPSFSLGGEFQVVFSSLGEVEESGDDIEDNTKESGQLLITTGLLTLRWYFI